MNIIRKTNGYRINDGLTTTLTRWENASASAFGNDLKEIEEFFYGDRLIMASIRLTSGDYGHFNVTERRISFNSHTCSHEIYNTFSQLTMNDELFPGGLV